MTKTYNAYLKAVRISPRKARLVVDMVRGKTVQDAIDTLRFTDKKAAALLSKLVASAMANATHTATVDVDNLVVAEAYVNEGPTIKRFLPRAQGRATPIRKRTSHFVVKLAELA